MPRAHRRAYPVHQNGYYRRIPLTGNTTLLIGAADEKVDEILGIIRSHCAQRMEPVPVSPEMGANGTVFFGQSAEVLVGGAIVFVTDVQYYEKM